MRLTGSSGPVRTLAILGVGVFLLLAAYSRSHTPAVLKAEYSSKPMSQPSLTIVALSDTHGLHRRPDLLRVPDGDILLFAGDAGIEDAHDAELFEKWLASQPHAHKLMTYGNMDMWAENKGRNDAPCKLINGVHVLCDSVVEVAGLRVLGSPATPKFYGAFQFASEEAARAHWQRVLPRDAHVDVLMTHGPPHGYGDSTRGRHVGDKALLDAVMAMEIPPKLWVCGHIHDSRGVYSVPHPKGPIPLVNAGVAYLAKGESEKQPFLIKYPPAAGDITVGEAPPAQEKQKSVWKAPLF